MVAFLVAGAVPAFALTREEARRDLPAAVFLRADFDRDGFLDEVGVGRFGSDTGGVILYPGSAPGTNRPVVSFLRPDYFPFGATTGDLDRDGRDEVIVGLYAPALRNPEVFVKKFHVFDIDSGTVRPLWFSERDFEEFRVVPWQGKPRLLEVRRQGMEWILSLFQWDGFGLWLDEVLLVSDRPFQLQETMRDRIIIGNRALAAPGWWRAAIYLDENGNVATRRVEEDD